MGSQKENETSVPSSEPKLCTNGCGFFGTAANMNLCSKCYRDIRIKEEQAASAKTAIEKKILFPKSKEPIVIDSVFSTPSSCDRAALEGDVEERRAEEVKVLNRCVSCKRKVGLMGFKCRCGSTFCGSHRYPENHKCEFDFKASAREEIANSNPVIKADKLERL